MKIDNRTATTTPARLVCIAVACMTVAMPAWSQDAEQRSGVSRPSSAPITTDASDSPASPSTVAVPSAPRSKPSAAIPATPSTTYGPYVPYRAADGTEPAAISPAQPDPDASIVTAATAGRGDRRLLSSPANAKGDDDAGIVTYVPSLPGEIPEGSLLKVRLREQLSTLTTLPGTRFTAAVSDPVMRDGQVVVPAGSMLEGRVTWVRGGKRLGGQAAIHLEPRSVTLPDGAQYMLRARAIDTDSWDNTKVDSEGTIMRSENKKRNLGVMSLTTGGGLAAGAMIAGPAGALVGAGVGAGVSTIVWLKQDRQAELPVDLQIVFSLTEPMSVTPATAAVIPVKIGSAGGE
jgi:hypothetical protein